MKTSPEKITGILLAGGMSSRMGREKGSMIIGKRMMYEYPLSILESVCDEILISGCQPLPGQNTHPNVCDRVKGIGPIGGIYSCLEQSSSDLNIVLSYDMPLVNEGLLNYLLEKAENFDMLVPATGPGQVEPLCALYRKGMSEVFRSLIEEKNYAVRRVIPKVASRILNIHQNLPFYHPDLFMNINTAQDLEKLREYLSHEK